MAEFVRIFHPSVVLHGGGVALVSDFTGQIYMEGTYGFFAGDTRVLWTYKFQINSCTWEMLGRTRSGYGSMQWHFQNPSMRDERGPLETGTVVFTLTRRVDGALHDDFEISAYADRTVWLRFAVQLDADFADLFQVKRNAIPPRLHAVQTTQARGLSLRHEREGFCRALHIGIEADQGPVLAGSHLIFELMLRHGERWHCCLEALP